MQAEDGHGERENAGEDGDAEDVHIVLLGGISPDDGVHAEDSGEQGVRRGGEQSLEHKMGDAERNILPEVNNNANGAVHGEGHGEVDSEKHEPSAEGFYDFINFLISHSKYLLTILAVRKQSWTILRKILPQKPSCVNGRNVIFIREIIEKNSRFMLKSVYNYLDFGRRTCYNVLSVIIGGEFS